MHALADSRHACLDPITEQQEPKPAAKAIAHLKLTTPRHVMPEPTHFARVNLWRDGVVDTPGTRGRERLWDARPVESWFQGN